MAEMEAANDQHAEELNDRELKARRKALENAARTLHGGGEREPHVEFERMAEWCRTNDVEFDRYGEGDGLGAFEAKVAGLLGYPAARFMPSGTMAQQIAARIWADHRGVTRIGMHPTCHVEIHEQRGYERLHGLSAVLIGDWHRPMSADDLEAVAGTLSMVIVELPTRENGGQLPPWDDLVRLSEVARERSIALHLDGARLWEAAAGFERPLDEICDLFDSTYVSFYKGIGAFPGSMLAGPDDFVEEAKLWQRRHGGNLFTQAPGWVSAAMRLDEQLEKMPAFRQRALEMAAALAPVPGIKINPDPPQVNMFHVFLEGDAESLLAARDTVAEEDGLWLFGGLRPTDVPNTVKFELTVGDAAFDVELDEMAAGFQKLITAGRR